MNKISADPFELGLEFNLTWSLYLLTLQMKAFSVGRESVSKPMLFRSKLID